MHKVRVNLKCVWKKGLAEPEGVMTDLELEEELRIYPQRMKFAENFRAYKSLLNLTQVMSKRRENSEKIIALAFLAFDICLLLGEFVQDLTYTAIDPRDICL